MGNDNSYEYLEEVSFGDALYRVPEEEMHLPIHRHIGALTFKLKGQPQYLGKGTGTLISPNLVFTVAHNIFHFITQQTYVDIKFYYRQCGTLDKYHEVDQYFFPEEFKKNNKTGNDYAILKLKQKIKAEDFIPLRPGQDIVTNEAQISIFGYPTTLNNYEPTNRKSEKLKVFQLGLTKSGRITAVRKQQSEIVHKISTEIGHSGSALLIEDSSSKLRIVGVHKGGVMAKIEGKKVEANSARLMTAEMISILKREALKMGADVFLDEVSPSKSQEERKENTRSHFKEGVLASDKGLWDEAAKNFRKVIEIIPNQKEAYKKLGNALFNTGDLKGAVENYRRAIEIDPKYKEAYYNLGIALSEAGDLKGAVENYRRAIQIDPNFKDPYNNLGIALYDTGDLKGAVENYRRAIEIDPKDKKAYCNLGIALKNTGDLKGTVENYRRAIEIDPKDKEAYCYLGNALFNTGDLKGAVENYRRAIEIDPNFKGAYYNLGNALKKTGDLKGAVENYRRAIEIDPNFKEAYNNLGIALSEAGDLKGAVENYRRAIDLDPKDKEAYNNLGTALSDTGDLKGAVENYRRAIEIDPNYILGYKNLFLQIEAKGGAGELLQVVKFVEGQVQKRPGNVVATNYLTKLRSLKK